MLFPNRKGWGENVSLNLALVGCGGMGLRHVRGYIELRRRFESLSLAAVCDLHREAADHVASEVEAATGMRPHVHTNFDQMLDVERGLDAVDIVTDTRMHHVFALKAFDAGLHVITEKPMGITLGMCQQMREAATNAGRKLAVAENFRRDPMNRFAKALLSADVIGAPCFAVKVGLGGGAALMHNTGWRARKSRAGSHILENAVHDCDLLLYFLGDIDTIYAETDVCFKVRRRAGVAGQLAQFYQHRVEDEFVDQQEVEVDTEDTAFGVVRFKSGVVGQLTFTSASVGYSAGLSSVHGSKGTLLLPPSRVGRGPELRLDGRRESLKGEELLALAPKFELDDTTAAFWDGKRRMASYEMPFEQIDARLVGIEYQDFAESILTGREPEVGPLEGMKALSVAYGLLESGRLRRPVSMDDVMSGAVSAYQSEIGVA